MSSLAVRSIRELREAYRTGTTTPAEVVARTYDELSRTRHNAFISVRPREQVLAEVAALSEERRESPLFGVPFGVKDNIDVAGIATTCACPELSYVPARSAPVVERLVSAGAVFIGKTNLDQFATGLSGTRSGYGPVASSRHPGYISGGSSSGSAVAVGAGLVPLALGTDTGGSGRVPAGFNGIVGLKPSRGLLSLRGVFPNCPSLDCVSVFTRDTPDAALALDILRGFDAEDPYSSPDAGERLRRLAELGRPPRVGFVPEKQRAFFGDEEAPRAYESLLTRLGAAGITLRELDFAPYFEAGENLFDGPWIAERRASLGGFIREHRDAVLPVIRTILDTADRFSAEDVFRAQRRLVELKGRARADFVHVDLLVVPTAPRAYRIAELEAEPIVLNNRLGTYSYFVNLLDLSALAIPVASYPNGVPIGATLIGPQRADALLLDVATQFRTVFEADRL
ncbi:MAG TPA: allophanate hydrolase [Polyangiaceae bacterium]|nr:allophanate hydrolase [Polyangiaceae bacterium]